MAKTPKQKGGTDMKYALLTFLLFSLHAGAVADDVLQSHRFEIFETSTRIFLLDRTSGSTWVFQDAPEPRWLPVQKEPIEQGLDAVANDRVKKFDAEAKLVASIAKSVQAGQMNLVRAVVTNHSATVMEDASITLDVGRAKIFALTLENTTSDRNPFAWRIKSLAPGKSQVFEAQLMFGKELIGKTPVVKWELQENSGKVTKSDVQTSVVAPKP